MIKVLFVCHGNICRSPMAEFVFKDLVRKRGVSDQFFIASAATTSEEVGSPVHYGTRRVLDSLGISCEGKVARRITRADFDEFDMIIGMDEANMRSLRSSFGKDDSGKLYKLMEFAGTFEDVADPWYTGDFATTYDDILAGCRGLLSYLGY